MYAKIRSFPIKSIHSPSWFDISKFLKTWYPHYRKCLCYKIYIIFDAPKFWCTSSFTCFRKTEILMCARDIALKKSQECIKNASFWEIFQNNEQGVLSYPRENQNPMCTKNPILLILHCWAYTNSMFLLEILFKMYENPQNEMMFLGVKTRKDTFSNSVDFRFRGQKRIKLLKFCKFTKFSRMLLNQ